MGSQIRVFHRQHLAQVDTAFAALANERPDELFINSGPFFPDRRVQLADLATWYGIPAVASILTILNRG